MTTQAARVALWVPTTTPPAVGTSIVVKAPIPAGAQAPIATEFPVARESTTKE